MAIAWKIYYTDGSDFSSSDGTPWDAPRQRVQIIAQQIDGEWDILDGADLICADFYYYEHGRFYRADYLSMWRHLLHAKQPLVLWGEMMDKKAFLQLRKEVLAEIKS